MQVRLHHLLLSLETSSPRIQDEWSQHFSPFLLSPDEEEAKREPDFTLDFSLQPSLSPPPAGHPAYRQPDLAVYETGDRFVIWQPQLGRLSVDPRTRCVTGEISTAALDLYGAFEDLNAVALAPLLRRRGWVLAHAFAAARDGRGLLLVGDNGSGKTTTGLALLADGWKLLSNDAALLGRCGGQVVAGAFPGRLSVHPEALQLVPSLNFPGEGLAVARPGWKLCVPAESLFAGVWETQAPVRAICLLSLAPGATEHTVDLLPPARAYGRLLAHSIDRWDREMLDFQMDLWVDLVQQAPVYSLDLGPDVSALPALLQKLVQ